MLSQPQLRRLREGGGGSRAGQERRTGTLGAAGGLESCQGQAGTWERVPACGQASPAAAQAALLGTVTPAVLCPWHAWSQL